MKKIFILVFIAAIAFTFVAIPGVSANDEKVEVKREEIPLTTVKKPCHKHCLVRPGRATPNPSLCYCTSVSKQ
jgi:hypothetical protein